MDLQHQVAWRCCLLLQKHLMYFKITQRLLLQIEKSGLKDLILQQQLSKQFSISTLCIKKTKRRNIPLLS